MDVSVEIQPRRLLQDRIPAEIRAAVLESIADHVAEQFLAHQENAEGAILALF